MSGQKLIKVDMHGNQMITLSNPSGGQSAVMSNRIINTTPANRQRFVIQTQKVMQPLKSNGALHQKQPQIQVVQQTPSPAASSSYNNNVSLLTVQMPTTPASNPIMKRKKVHKVNKGLRHFSMKVCEKVKEKGTTTYNEVADELVADEIRRERAALEPGAQSSYDQKNIRRRVYDALNVLMAMNIISKEKKEIRWLGLPGNSMAQCANLDQEIEIKRKGIAAKEKELKDLLLLQVSLKSLVERNRLSEEQGYTPTPNSHIQLPFIVVNTHKETHINCSISHDKTEYFFKFDDKFEIHDHVKVLQRMGLLMGLDTGTCTDEDIEKIKELVPPQFQKLIEHYGRGNDRIDYEVITNDSDIIYQDEFSEMEDDEEEQDDDDMD